MRQQWRKLAWSQGLCASPGGCALIGVLPGLALLLCWLWMYQLPMPAARLTQSHFVWGSLVPYCPLQPHACSTGFLPPRPPQAFILAVRTDMVGTGSLPGMCLPDLQELLRPLQSGLEMNLGVCGCCVSAAVRHCESRLSALTSCQISTPTVSTGRFHVVRSCKALQGLLHCPAWHPAGMAPPKACGGAEERADLEMHRRQPGPAEAPAGGAGWARP